MFKRSIVIFFVLIAALLCGDTSNAQEARTDSAVVQPSYLTWLNYRSMWKDGPNAAGLRQDSIATYAYTRLNFNRVKGGFKLAQQAAQSQNINFESERFQNIGKTLFYGKFSYTQQWDKQLRFSDVLDSYRGTPYVLADSIGGDWKKQLYALSLKAVSKGFAGNKLTLGLAADLSVGSGARQNDPRPQATNNQIAVMPGLNWKLSQQLTLGANGLYGRYREDVSLEVKNSNINHYLYKSLGLGQLELPTTFTTGASRIYKGNKWGGDMQLQWQKSGMNLFTTIGYRSYSEQVSDGTSVPRKSGTWKQSDYHFKTILNIDAQSLQHRISVYLQRLEDSGIEFHEYYNTSIKAWQTLLEAEFYQAETDLASVSYSLIKPDKTEAFKWLAELGGNYYATNRTYLIPASVQEIKNVGLWLSGAKMWNLNNGSALQTGIKVLYGKNLSNALTYIPITGDRTLLAREVLYPDQSYLSTGYVAGSLNIQYSFKIKTVKNARFLIGGNFTNQQALGTNSYPNATGYRNYWSFSLGALY